jgi:hypothetical protein
MAAASISQREVKPDIVAQYHAVGALQTVGGFLRRRVAGIRPSGSTARCEHQAELSADAAAGNAEAVGSMP